MTHILHNDSKSEQNPLRNHIHPDPLGIFITIQEASSLSHVSARSFLKALYRGVIRSPDPLSQPEPQYKKNQEQLNYLYNAIRIPLSVLKPFAIMAYWNQHKNDHYIDLDLGAELNEHGWKGVFQLCENILTLLKIDHRNSFYYSSNQAHLLKELVADAGLSRSTYFEELRKMYQIGYFKSHQAMLKGIMHVSLCPASEDYLSEHVIHFNHPSCEDMRLALVEEAKLRGQDFCRDCAHNPLSSTFKQAKSDLKKTVPTFCLKECRSPTGGMKYPDNQSTVWRFVNSLQPSLIYFCQHEKKNWSKHFLYKLDRQARYYGEVFFCDFVQLDIQLAIYYAKNKPVKTMKPWACIISDGYTGAIVSSSVSLCEPTTQDVIRCLAVACVYKVDSPFHGAPQYFYTDAGSALTATALRGEKKTESLEDSLKESFFTEGFLPLMNIQWLQQPDSHPWVKSIERINETIQYKDLPSAPGWSGGARRRKFKAIIGEEFNRLVKNQALWTISDFAFFWHDYLVPAYNNYKSPGQQSPLEKYVENPDLLTPSWSTISVFAESKDIPEIRPDGIIHNGRKYSSPEILKYVKNPDVQLYIYDFGSPITHCIPVFVKNKNNGINRFLGLAYEKEVLNMVNEDHLKLEQELAIQYIQTRDVKDKAEGITYLSELMNFNNKMYINYTREERKIIRTRYPTRVDRSKSDQLGTHLSSEALKAKAAEYKAIATTLEVIACQKEGSMNEGTAR